MNGGYLIMINLNDVVEFIENKNNIKLTHTQKLVLENIICGKTVYTPRCVGRSLLYNGYADYLKEKVGNYVDYNADDYDITFNIILFLCDNEYNNFGIAKERLSEMAKDNPERFRKEFMGGIPNDYLSIFDNIYNHIDG